MIHNVTYRMTRRQTCC